jgi:hypothetical protein
MNAFDLFFPEDLGRVEVSSKGLERSEVILRTLNEAGYGACVKLLKQTRMREPASPVSLAMCMKTADIARASLEIRGYDLGEDRCLARSMALAAYMWESNVPVELKIGVSRFASLAESEFHAWNEYQGTPIAAYREVVGVFEIVQCIGPAIVAECRE